MGMPAVTLAATCQQLQHAACMAYIGSDTPKNPSPCLSAPRLPAQRRTQLPPCRLLALLPLPRLLLLPHRLLQQADPQPGLRLR